MEKRFILSVTLAVVLIAIMLTFVSNAQQTSAPSSAVSPAIVWSQGSSIPIVNGHKTPPPQPKPLSSFINSSYAQRTNAPFVANVPPTANFVHFYQGSVYGSTASTTAKTIKMTIKVPNNANPPADEFYYVIESAWDSAGSYDQLGFTNDFGAWGLAYSWTTGGTSNITYHYSPDAMNLTPGATYTFYMTTSGGQTDFQAYQGSNLVWSLIAPTGGEYLNVDNFYQGYYAYTDYEEVYYVDNATPPFNFLFYNNKWITSTGVQNNPTWAVMDIFSPPEASTIINFNSTYNSSVLVDNNALGSSSTTTSISTSSTSVPTTSTSSTTSKSTTSSSTSSSSTTSASTTSTQTTTTISSGITYAYSGNIASLSLTLPQGYSTYICNGANWEEGFGSSWVNDVNNKNLAQLGRQSGNVCTSTVQTYQSLAGIGVSGATLSQPVQTFSNLALSSGFSYNYVVNNKGSVVISVACGYYPCTSISVPAGCTTVVSENVGTSDYGTSYIAICNSQSPGTYGVSGTLQSNGYAATAVYVFGASSSTTTTTSTSVSTSTSTIKQITYAYARNTNSTTLTVPSGYSSYICNGANFNNDFSTSWVSDSGILYAHTGRQTSNVCTVSQGQWQSLGGIGLNNAVLAQPVQTYTTSSNSFAVDYNVQSNSAFVVISVACGYYQCTSINVPSGCTAVVAENVGTVKDGTSYMAICSSENENTYAITGTLLAPGNVALSVYVFS